jgi:excisionase family DNA binding protein
MNTENNNPLAGRVTCSPAEAASALGISRVSLYSLISQKLLRPAKMGTRTLIKVDEVQSLHDRLLERAV